MIHQVIYNLVDNAVKFTDEGGKICVSVALENDRVIAGIRNTSQGFRLTKFQKYLRDFTRSTNLEA